jgi:hypothetical protein
MSVLVVGIGLDGVQTANSIASDTPDAVTTIGVDYRYHVLREQWATDETVNVEDKTDEETVKMVKAVATRVAENEPRLVVVIPTAREWGLGAANGLLAALDQTSVTSTIHTVVPLDDDPNEHQFTFTAEAGVLGDSLCYYDVGFDVDEFRKRLAMLYSLDVTDATMLDDITWVAKDEGFVLGRATSGLATRSIVGLQQEMATPFEEVLEDAMYRDLSAAVAPGSGRRTLVIIYTPDGALPDGIENRVTNVVDMNARVHIERDDERDEVEILVVRG